MNYAAAWFLLAIGGQYIGPFPQAACEMAASSLRSEGVVCRKADALMMCGVDGRPGTFTACPVFDLPKVTVKP